MVTAMSTEEELAALKEQVTALTEKIEALLAAQPDAHLPEECRTRECDYYTHYLAYGPAELEHEGYHAACKQFEEAHNRVDRHAKECLRCQQHERCPHWDRLLEQTYPWEKRIRA